MLKIECKCFRKLYGNLTNANLLIYVSMTHDHWGRVSLLSLFDLTCKVYIGQSAAFIGQGVSSSTYTAALQINGQLMSSQEIQVVYIYLYLIIYIYIYI